MNLLDNIDSLLLKRRAVESLLSDEANRELIADRIIVLFDGNIHKLDMLFSGIPCDFADAGERLRAEEWYKNSQSNIHEVTGVAFNSTLTVTFTYTYGVERFIMPGDEEARQAALADKYSDRVKYYKTGEYTEVVICENTGSDAVEICDLEKAGIRFTKL